MSARIIRRDAFQVRRDAAVELPNARVSFDALFTRWGLQEYPDGVEFRPFDEVEKSMETLGALPGVLLHPDQNFGTSFGEGAYPVLGCTAEAVAWADDKIHTKGKLIVWGSTWLDAIMSAEVAELSAGYTIDPDPTPGTAPEGAPGSAELGLDYVLVHREIINDHMAGVPEGNAGTARVVLDAAARSTVPRVTRLALADIAAARMDAKPMYHDLGSWHLPPRKPKQDQTMLTKQAQFFAAVAKLDRKDAKAHTKAVKDAWVDIYGESDDPGMKAALAALGGVDASPAPAAAPAAPVADAEEDPPEEEEPAKEPPAESEGEEDPPDEEMEDKDDEDEADEETANATAKADAALEREDARADAVSVARAVLGWSWSPKRADGTRKTVGEIRTDCVTKVDPAAMTSVRSLARADQATGLRLKFAEVRLDVATGSRLEHVDALCSTINAARQDTRTPADADLAEAGKRHDALITNAAKVGNTKTRS